MRRWFTVADCNEGYYQVLLKKEHKHKTSFYFENVLYQHKRILQGFKNASAIFQRFMDNLLEEETNVNICCPYLDDIVIHAHNEEHDKNVHKVF